MQEQLFHYFCLLLRGLMSLMKWIKAAHGGSARRSNGLLSWRERQWTYICCMSFFQWEKGFDWTMKCSVQLLTIVYILCESSLGDSRSDVCNCVCFFLFFGFPAVPQCSPQCENRGTCIGTNRCRCPSGFIGNRCQTASRWLVGMKWCHWVRVTLCRSLNLRHMQNIENMVLSIWSSEWNTNKRLRLCRKAIDLIALNFLK